SAAAISAELVAVGHSKRNRRRAVTALCSKSLAWPSAAFVRFSAMPATYRLAPELANPPLGARICPRTLDSLANSGPIMDQSYNADLQTRGNPTIHLAISIA